MGRCTVCKEILNTYSQSCGACGTNILQPEINELLQEIKDLKKLLKDVLYYIQKLPQNKLLRDMAYKAVGEKLNEQQN